MGKNIYDLGKVTTREASQRAEGNKGKKGRKGKKSWANWPQWLIDAALPVIYYTYAMMMLPNKVK